MGHCIPEDQVSEILVAREKHTTACMRKIQDRTVAGIASPFGDPFHIESDPSECLHHGSGDAGINQYSHGVFARGGSG